MATPECREGNRGQSMNARDSTARPPSHSTSERLIVGGVAVAVLALHLATNGLYGFHRDELYYLDSARHLAWGFVDYPPLTPAIARMSELLFGSSVRGLRLWPSLASSAAVGTRASSPPSARQPARCCLAPTGFSRR